MPNTSHMKSSHAESVGSLAGFETHSRPAEGLTGKLGRVLLPDHLAREGIQPRIGLLFVALCLIKVTLLVGLQKYLFEVHWRVGGEPYNWLNEAGFYLFAVLVGLHLWKLGTQCLAAGTRVVRAANAWVLVLGAAFILLTLHEGTKNYLSPVMNSVLTWKNLGSYLALDFFFRTPYLAAWILAYAFLYYVLVRTGHEHLVLRLTAVSAGAYVVFCLRDLTKYQHALVIVGCVGVACLLSSWGVRRALGLFWIGLFALGVGFVFGLFYGLDTRLTFAHADPEFALLTGTSLVLLAGVSLLAWRRGFFNSWSWVLPFALVAFLLFLNVNYGPARNYHKLLCEGFSVARYFLGEFVVVALLGVLALAYRRWRPAGSLLWMDLAGLVFIAFALADLRLSQIMGARLDWQALSLALGETPRMMWRMARPYLSSLLFALAITAVLYVSLLWILRQCEKPSARLKAPPALPGARFLLLSSLMLGFAGNQLLDHDKAEGQSLLLLAQTSQLWRRAADPVMDRKTFTEGAQSLGMVELVRPATVSLRPVRNLNVVLILLESSYNKHLSLFDGTEDTQPLLSGYKDRMEIFPNFFANFAGSMNARFATFTGLYPAGDYRSFTLQRVEVQSLFELLHHHGYWCSLFYSSFLDYTGFRDFLKGRELDEVYDADTMPGERRTKPVSWGLREEETLGAIQAGIKRYAAENQKFFLTYVPAAPHHPYDATPPRFRKFKMGQIGDYTPLYLNELRYMDWIITSIIDQLKDSGVLDRTLVVITDDHGELLGENGGPIGHGWAVTPELANIPLIIMDPERRGYRINYTVGSQVDVPPTVLDLLGIAVPEDDLCQGTSLYSPGVDAQRTIYLNSFRQYGVVRGQSLICGDRETTGRSPPEEVFTITNQGARTFFVAEPSTNALPVPIASFDKFQANLLRHYSQYCQSLRSHVTRR
jgi:hypothetical protein